MLKTYKKIGLYWAPQIRLFGIYSAFLGHLTNDGRKLTNWMLRQPSGYRLPKLPLNNNASVVLYYFKR